MAIYNNNHCLQRAIFTKERQRLHTVAMATDIFSIPCLHQKTLFVLLLSVKSGLMVR